MLLCQIPLKLRKNNISLFCYLTRNKYLKICWEKSGKQCSLDAPNKQRHKCLTLSLPEYLMEICKVTLTFESADEILWCHHSNETSLPVLTHGAIYFSKFHKMKFGRNLLFAKFGSERVKLRLRHDDTIPDSFLYVSEQERVILLGPAVNMPVENQSCIVT